MNLLFYNNKLLTSYNKALRYVMFTCHFKPDVINHILIGNDKHTSTIYNAVLIITYICVF